MINNCLFLIKIQNVCQFDYFISCWNMTRKLFYCFIFLRHNLPSMVSSVLMNCLPCDQSSLIDLSVISGFHHRRPHRTRLNPNPSDSKLNFLTTRPREYFERIVKTCLPFARDLAWPQQANANIINRSA